MPPPPPCSDEPFGVMHKPPADATRTEAHFEIGRTGLASLLLGLLRPSDARAAAVNANALVLKFASRSIEVPLGNIEDAEMEAEWLWSGVRIRCPSMEEAVWGLSQDDARALADALEAARVGWWRRELAARTGTLRSVIARLADLENPPRYMARRVFSDLTSEAEIASRLLPSRWPDTLSSTPDIRMLKTIRDFLKAPERFREMANATFVANELNRSEEFLDRVEARPLSREQRRAVVIDEDRNLVVAAAGSGKTSVIVAKTGWLIRKGYRRPSELLVLAFARDARKELEERLVSRLGADALQGLTVRTFHSLGMSIIGEAEGRRPTLAKVAEDDKALCDLLKGITGELLEDKRFQGILANWFQAQFAPYRSEHEFRTRGEYWDYIRRNEIRSLKGEKVRSFQECEIANFLYLNGVAYEYEAPYEHDTATAEKRQYQPDFHLPDAGIYIEHLALNASGDTPPFIDREEYLSSLEWKRKLHAEHGTILVETFSHEHAAGKLTENLARKLADHGVVLSPIPPEEMFTVLEEQGRIDSFTRLTTTFLHHFKSARLSFGEVSRRAAGLRDPLRAEVFLAVFESIFERYRDTLSELGQIDFHDMINTAAELVEAGRYRSPFGYILVDEFQDISPGRARLLKALLDRSPTAQLFAVGDDWQSIYRFGGSDIAIMREFPDRFGCSERIDLETTFRCVDRIAEVATEFVLDNPAQIRKKVRSTRAANEPRVHVGLPGNDVSLLREALDRIAEDAAEHDGVSTVLLLGRYRHTRPQDMSHLARKYPALRLKYMTVHGSKGLEADYVVVLGLCTGKYGFPTEIEDDPLLDLVLAAPEGHPNAEERRLFYVAMTRARRRVFLLAVGDPPSPFVLELLEGAYDVTVFGRMPESDMPCPICVTGRIEHRTNRRDESTFYGCSNWPYCEHTQRPCPACGKGPPVERDGKHGCRDCGKLIESCPTCDGWLETRTGKYGRFLGCSNWPACDYTRNIQQQRAS